MSRNRVQTGITGLDEILMGGFLPNRSYLVQGGPGTGKSTLGYHFLREGIDREETVLYITLDENRDSILDNASRMNIDLSDVQFLDLTPDEDITKNESTYSVFPSSDIERGPILNAIIESIREYQPQRVFLDSITMLQYLSRDPLQLRKQALSLIQFICSQGATLLMSTEKKGNSTDNEAPFWVDGIINLEYAPEWRKLSVHKFRGSDFIDDTHAYRLHAHGFSVFPRIKPAEYMRSFLSEPLSSGIEEFDAMTHGGIEQGTITLVTGPTGVGKTNLCIQFIKEAATRGERSVIYTFEESREIIVKRSESIGVPIQSMLDNNTLNIVPIEPLNYSPDEFSNMVRMDIEENGTKMVTIDTIGAYSIAVREENSLERLHALTVYLQNMGVTGFLVNESQDITGGFQTTTMNASYLADNILFLRYLENRGEIQKVIGILKKRLSDFDKALRKFSITSKGLHVGEKLSNLQGILTGTPESVTADGHKD